MIRLDYLYPRLAVMLAFAAAVHFGLDPLLRRAAVEVGERSLGARFEIGSLATSLPRGEVELRDVQVADRARPERNLLQFASATARLDPAALAWGKVVVRSAEIHGLEFDEDRATPGAVDHRWSLGLGKWFPSGLRLGSLDAVESYARGKLREELDLETIRVAEDIRRRWTGEFDRLDQRSGALRARIEAVRQQVQNPGRDTLARIETFRRVAREVDLVYQDLRQLPLEVGPLQAQARADRQQLDEARQRDLTKLQSRLKLLELDPQAMSEFLLGPESAAWLKEAAGWAQWGRERLPTRIEPPDPVRARGRLVHFRDARDTQPDILVQSLLVDGRATVNGAPLDLVGSVWGLSSDPARHDQPLVFKAQTSGAVEARIQVLVDQRQTPPVEQVYVECPALAVGARQLGRPDQVALAVGPGTLQLALLLNLRGDAVEGRLTLKQDNASLSPQVAEAFGGQRMSDALGRAMSGVRTLDASLELGGTLDAPQFRVHSAVALPLAQALQTALAAELNRAAGELRAQAEQELAQQMRIADRALTEREQAFLASLRLSEQEIQQCKDLVAERLKIPGVSSETIREGASLLDLFRK